ncbi:MAG: arginase family protein [Gemmatimonadales bacterium]
MRIELIAVPYDSAHRGRRMGAGPEYLLRAGLPDRLATAGYQVHVRVLEAPADAWHAEIRTAFDLTRGVAEAVRNARSTGAFPLVLSGNCGPAALGCVAGLGTSPGIFWFDSHGDFNTPETTLGGFLDGMCLATATGRCWSQLSAAIPGFRPVPDSSVALLGMRDLDPLEAAALDQSGILQVRPAELRARLPLVVSSVGRATTATYLHLDLDVLDPGEGRANAFAAPEGPSRADLAWAIAAIAAERPLGAAALTSFDPDSDTTGRAVSAALELGLRLAQAADPANRGEAALPTR